MPERSTLERLFPEDTVVFNGVTIVIKPLPFHKVPDLLDAIQALWPVFSGEGADLRGLFDHICTLLDPCVTIPEAPEINVRELPLKVMPDLLSKFAEQSLDVGKWFALAGSLNLSAGAN